MYAIIGEGREKGRGRGGEREKERERERGREREREGGRGRERGGGERERGKMCVYTNNKCVHVWFMLTTRVQVLYTTCSSVYYSIVLQCVAL